jgi:hypothetical protein
MFWFRLIAGNWQIIKNPLPGKTTKMTRYVASNHSLSAANAELSFMAIPHDDDAESLSLQDLSDSDNEIPPPCQC